METYPISTQFSRGSDIIEKEGLSANFKAVNAGVMRIDLKSWRSNQFARKALQLADIYGWDTFSFCDQSLINVLGYSTGTLSFFPKRFNFMMWPDLCEDKSTHPIYTNSLGLLTPDTGEGLAKIVHWTGPLKPWHQEFKQLTVQQQYIFCGPCYEQFL
jgi:lipopolysaccharide biosynthesis glycosyltransferase